MNIAFIHIFATSEQTFVIAVETETGK